MLKILIQSMYYADRESPIGTGSDTRSVIITELPKPSEGFVETLLRDPWMQEQISKAVRQAVEEAMHRAEQ